MPEDDREYPFKEPCPFCGADVWHQFSEKSGSVYYTTVKRVPEGGWKTSEHDKFHNCPERWKGTKKADPTPKEKGPIKQAQETIQTTADKTKKEEKEKKKAVDPAAQADREELAFANELVGLELDTKLENILGDLKKWVAEYKDIRPLGFKYRDEFLDSLIGKFISFRVPDEAISRQHQEGKLAYYNQHGLIVETHPHWKKKFFSIHRITELEGME